jgi:hypothetical protein
LKYEKVYLKNARRMQLAAAFLAENAELLGFFTKTINASS